MKVFNTNLKTTLAITHAALQSGTITLFSGINNGFKSLMSQIGTSVTSINYCWIQAIEGECFIDIYYQAAKQASKVNSIIVIDLKEIIGQEMIRNGQRQWFLSVLKPLAESFDCAIVLLLDCDGEEMSSRDKQSFSDNSDSIIDLTHTPRGLKQIQCDGKSPRLSHNLTYSVDKLLNRKITVAIACDMAETGGGLYELEILKYDLAG